MRLGPVEVASGGPPDGPVSVLVFDAKTDDGIAGAVIAAEDGRRWTSDGSGRFLAKLPLSCDVAHPLYRDERRMRVDWRWPAIPLRAGATVTGAVRLAEGAPAAGVTVHAGREHAETDAAGRYVVGGLPDGEPVEVVAAAEWDAAKIVEPGAEDVDFVLAGSVLRVRALDEAGEPISGASHRVSWGGRSEEETGTPWTTWSVPPDVPILVRASAPGRFAEETTVPATTSPQCLVVELVLRGAPAAIVPIVVKDGTERHFHEAFVSVVREGREEMRAHVSLSGRNRGRTEHLPPGEHLVCVTTSPGFSCERWVVAREGENATVEFVVPQPVHVELQWNGEPGAEVELRPLDGAARFFRLSRSPYRPDGPWHSSWVPAGTYVLRASRDGRTLREQTLDLQPPNPFVVEWNE